MNAYLFFTALGVTITLSPTYFLLRKHKQSPQKAFFLLGIGLFLLILFSKLFGVLGYYLFTKELDFAPTSIMGLLLFVIFFAKPWALKNKEMGSELLGLWSYLMPFSQTIGRLGCHFAGCCFARHTQSFSWPLTEAAFTLLIAAFLYTKRRELNPLRAFRIYLFSYLILRFFLEFLRGDFIRGFIGPLSLPQWTSLGLFCWVFLDSFLDKYHNKAHEIRSRRTRK